MQRAKMRVGLVGAGFIANVHSWALWAVRKAGVADVRVTAVCDEQPDKATALATPHGAEVVSFEQLCDRVDVVYICTPTAQHLALVEAAVERGLAVFCEKPLAPNLSDASRVAELLSRVPHQVGLVLRTSPVFVAMAEAISSGRYGAPMVATLRDDQFFPIQGQYASTWRADHAVAGGGTLIEHSIHDIDLFAMLFGAASSVTCRTTDRFGYDGIEDVAVASIACEDGVVANLVSVWHQIMSRPSTRRLEVFCEDAMLWTTDDNTGPLRVHTTQGEETIECPIAEWAAALPVAPENQKALAMYGEATRRFLESVAAERSSTPGAAEALAAHRVVDACYRSAEQGGSSLSV